MSSYQDTKSGEPNTNSGRISDAQISDNFNNKNALEDKIKTASPETQRKVRDRIQLRDERLEKEKRDQKRFRNMRIQKETNRMLKDYILDDVPRPDTASSKAQDVAIIEQKAEELVTAKEAYFLKQIEQQAEKDVHHILNRDRQQNQQHTHNHSDHEQGR
ncbi:MAG: hypothetical protein OIF58_05120 [Cohaesibacter sp.]|nr:hypothetical protein [Cohaesibacter sp.]